MKRRNSIFRTRDASILAGGLVLTVFLVLHFWWPLAEAYLAYIDWDGPWWRHLDWLLIAIYAFISVTIIAGAHLRRDPLIVFVGICGGLAIETWGTQTGLWRYYTNERPPLWIVPAWPIASLCIDRITRMLGWIADHLGSAVAGLCRALYWPTFAAFLILMLQFVAPTFDEPFTWFALTLCIFLILTPTDYRFAVLTFIAGTGLGYFLELWGTSRRCWTYYTFQTPPLFAVFAHGMAAVAFWRAGLVVNKVWRRLGFRKHRQFPSGHSQGAVQRGRWQQSRPRHQRQLEPRVHQGIDAPRQSRKLPDRSGPRLESTPSR